MTAATIKKEDFKTLFETLEPRYRMIGPRAEKGAIVLGDISFADIPAGYEDRQAAGSSRLEETGAGGTFTFSPGPDSFKKFLFPPSETLFSFRKTDRNIVIQQEEKNEKPMAFVGVRACDLAALELLDRIFLGGPVQDRRYERRRKELFIVAATCLRPGANCFCDSLGTGPEARTGFDLSITEIPASFLIEAGSAAGAEVLEKMPREQARDADLAEKRSVVSRCRKMMKKSLQTGDLPGILYRNMEHPRWAEIADKDLECGNCTMVCPTCFCNSRYDVLSLSTVTGGFREYSGRRQRSWDSCFSRNFARVHGGNFRPSRRTRYRQWMTHKLAYWIDQFGSPGCVGCGRCITWCPAGIDITTELEELRRVR